MSSVHGNIFRRLFGTGLTKRSQQCPTSHGVAPPQHEETHQVFKRLALFLGLPIVVGLSMLTFFRQKICEEEREPFHKYPYLRIRTKRFPWGDGEKTLFHNSRTNPLPDGYEDEIENEEC